MWPISRFTSHTLSLILFGFIFERDQALCLLHFHVLTCLKTERHAHCPCRPQRGSPYLSGADAGAACGPCGARGRALSHGPAYWCVMRAFYVCALQIETPCLSNFTLPILVSSSPRHPSFQSCSPFFTA